MKERFAGRYSSTLAAATPKFVSWLKRIVVDANITQLITRGDIKVFLPPIGTH